MSRLKEADIRRIVREEVLWCLERYREESDVSSEAVNTWKRLKDKGHQTGALMVQDVIDAYWKVVEEEVNE